MSASFSSSKLIITTSLLSLATGAILSVSENENLQKRTGDCLPGMRKFMREFDICKTEKTCFLFRKQSKFIGIPSAMKSVEHQRLFPCYKHHLVHPDLGGLSFDVLKRTSFLESKCAWVGRNCSYNQLVYFMAEKAKQGFRFTSLNALLESERRLNISRMSTPFYQAKIAIIGPKDNAMPLEPIETLRRPFKRATWAFVTCILITFLVLYLWIEFRWPSVYNPFSSVTEELGKNSLTEGNDVEGYGRRALSSVRVQIIRRVLWGSLIMFVTICLILYEPAAVNFLFRQSSAKLSKNLASFSNKELALYGLERDQAVEDTFRELVDGGSRFLNRTYPWHRFTKIEDCWKTFLNSQGQVRNSVVQLDLDLMKLRTSSSASAKTETPVFVLFILPKLPCLAPLHSTAHQRQKTPQLASQMDVAGLIFAVVAEVRELLRSLTQRYQNITDNPTTFSTLMHDASRIEQDIHDCNTQLANNALHVSRPFNNLVHRRFKSIQSRFEASRFVLDKLHSKAFPHPHSGAASHATSKVYQTIRAKALRNELEKVSLNFRDANHEIIAIANLLGISHISEKLAQNNTAHTHPCRSTAPALTHRAFLRYDGCDENGEPTPEHQLKKYILGTSGSTVTAATGHTTEHTTEHTLRTIGPVPSAQGMAGVGKTVALKGLAADKDIRKRFSEIHYITLGHDATTPKVVSELARIVRESGGEWQAEKVCKCNDLGEAVRATGEWFSGKVCLFLVDDVWQTSQNMHGYLSNLRQLLSSCEQSRMAISTRDRGIAREAGQWVKFGARDAQTSREIFLRYFDTGKDVEWSSTSVESSVQNILQLCGGLPLALAIAGRAAEQLVEQYGSAEEALAEYATRLRKKKSSIVNASSGEYKSLRSAIEVSLDFLDGNVTSDHSGEYQNLRMRKHSFGDLYRALCVLKAQSWAPTSMLERLWRFNRSETSIVMELFCNLSLASSEYRRYNSMRSGRDCGQICLSIHDLQLEYCQEQTRVLKSSKAWHRQLLGSYLSAEGDDMESQDTSGTGSALRNTNTDHRSRSVSLNMNSSVHILPRKRAHASAMQGNRDPWTTRPRLWWSDDVYDDNYIYANVARHLVQGGNSFELLALLLDARWTKLRLKVGGILALQEDFAALTGHGKAYESDEEYEQARRYTEDLSVILNAIRCSWQYIGEMVRQMPTQLGARLFELRRISVAARRYLESVEESTERPYLEARSLFLPDARSAQVSELQLNGPCDSLDISSCGKYILAGVGYDAVVIDQGTLAVVSRLKRCKRYPQGMCFIPHSNKIIFCSDEMVKVWDMSKPHEDALTLKGHTGWVHSVCASSDGALVASGSSDSTIRVWDLRGGPHDCKILRAHTDSVTCVCFSPDGTRIASGSSDNTVRLWDIRTELAVCTAILEHSRGVMCVAFSPDGCLLASAAQDRTFRLWNVRSGVPTRKVLRGHRARVNSVSFSADGARIVLASDDGTIRIWDVQNCAVVGVLRGHTGGVNSVKFSCDGTRVVSGSADKTLRVWDITKVGAADMAREGHSGKVSYVAFSEDGALIATGSLDRTIRLWDGRNGAAVGKPLQVHNGGVACVAFSADGALLASCSSGGTVRLWDTRSCAAVGDALHLEDDGFIDYGNYEVGFSVDGSKIAHRSGVDYLFIWSVSSGQLLWKSDLHFVSRDASNVLHAAEARELIQRVKVKLGLKEIAEQSLHVHGHTVMMRHDGSDIPLAALPLLRIHVSVPWRYFRNRNELVAVLEGGSIAVLRLNP